MNDISQHSLIPNEDKKSDRDKPEQPPVANSTHEDIGVAKNNSTLVLDESIMAVLVKVRSLRVIVTPLMCVMMQQSNRQAEQGDRKNIEPMPLAKEATMLAALVKQAVMMGKHLSRHAVNRCEELQNPENRDLFTLYKLELAGYAVNYLAGLYRDNGNVPSARDSIDLLGQLDAAIEAMGLYDVPFPTAEKLILPISDQNSYLNTANPIIRAVRSFAFGKNEASVTRKIFERIEGKAALLLARLCPKTFDIHIDEGLYRELIHIFALLYEECHYQEMTRLAALSEDERIAYIREHDMAYPLEPVWDILDQKINLLTMLLRHLDSQQA